MQCATEHLVFYPTLQQKVSLNPPNYDNHVSNDEDAFIEKAMDLYTNEDLWKSAQNIGFMTLRKRFISKNEIQFLLKEYSI